MNYKELTDLLRKEVKPALGCPYTFPFATSSIKPYLSALVEELTMYVGPNFFRGSFGVPTAGTTERGIGFGATMGIVCGNAKYGSESLKDATPADIKKAKEMVGRGFVKVICDRSKDGIYVKAVAKTANETVELTIAGTHDTIVSVVKNGKEIYYADTPETSEIELSDLTPSIVLEYIHAIDPEEIRFMLDGVKMNMRLAEDGLKNEFALQSGKILLKSLCPNPSADLFENPFKYLPKDPAMRSKILVAAASDARMGGSNLPAMTTMGDGNQGISCILPVAVAAEEYGVSEEMLIRAIALSHLMTFCVKIHLGRATSVCLCALSSSSGAASAITFLRGGSDEKVKEAVKIVLSPLAGIYCDGAKGSCALKMAIGASEVFYASTMALSGMKLGYFDGIADETLEETIANVGATTTLTKDVLDHKMVDIVLAKEKRALGEKSILGEINN